MRITEIVVELIKHMEAEEQKEFIASMADGKQPHRRPVPMTVEELWWQRKLGQGANMNWRWQTDIPVADLVAEYMKAVGWTRTPQGARSSLGHLLKRLCPGIRLVDGRYLMPSLEEARKDFLEECPRGGGKGGKGAGNNENQRPRMRLEE